MAARIGAHLMGLSGVAALLPPETNIVIFDLTEDAPDAEAVVAEMSERGIRIGALAARRIRVVTHLDVGPAEEAALTEALSVVLG